MVRSKLWLMVVGVVTSIAVGVPLAGLSAEEGPAAGDAPDASPYEYQGCFGSDPNDCRDLFVYRSAGVYYVCGPCGTMADPSRMRCSKIDWRHLGMLDAC